MVSRTLFKTDIEEALAGLSTVSKPDLPTSIDSLVQRIHALEKTVTEKISILPPYDARMCMEAIKYMCEQLNLLRTKLVPKAKFSFKSRKAAASSTATSPASSPASTPRLGSPQPKPTSAVDQDLFMKFENRTGEHLFIGSLPVPTSEEGVAIAKDVSLTNLTDCTVNLVHNIPLGAVHIRNLKNCTLVIPPVSGSILLHDCEGCTLIGACHQSRMHSSSNMNIYLHVTSEPIIEDCTNMRFAPFILDLPAQELDRLFEIAQLARDKNFYDKVKDFNWLRQQQSPNWRLLDSAEIEKDAAEAVLAKDRSHI
ncbi:hypothetical protein EDD11_008709 [Mortierella claussenii]|nr:hypothetical protein EDD11_008709 [Mortierella claussenii]